MPKLYFNAITGEFKASGKYKFSFFNSLADFAPKTISLTEFREMVFTEQYDRVVQRVRTAFCKEQKSEFKKALPAVTFSGVFSGGRRQENLVNHSGLICLDFDLDDNAFLKNRLPEIRAKLAEDQFSLLVFCSAGGNGLAVVCRIEPDRHTDAFEALCEYFRAEYGIIADKACKDISRLRFLTSDNQIKHNENARLFRRYSLLDFTSTGVLPNHPQVSQPTSNQPNTAPVEVFLGVSRVDEIKSALDYMSSEKYADWILIGQAINSECPGAQGLDIWDKWSQKSEKYTPGQCDKKWRTFGRRNGVNIESLFKLAYAGGWSGPASVESPFKLDKVEGVNLTLPTISAATWALQEEEKRRPVLSNVIDAGDMLEIISPSKMRKSFFALQCAISCAVSGSFLKWSVSDKQVVLYLNFEIAPGWMHRRLRKMLKNMALRPSDVEQLHIANTRGLDCPSMMDAITETVRQVKPSVVFLDPLYMLHDGDENAAHDMKPLLRRFMALMAEFDASVVSVHHDPTGTPGDRNIRDRGAGSGIWSRAVDARIALTPHAKEEDLICIDTMTRNFPPFEGFVCSFDGMFAVVDDVEYMPETTKGSQKRISLADIGKQSLAYVAQENLEYGVFRDEILQGKMGLSRRKSVDVIRKLLDSAELAKSKKHLNQTYLGTPVNIDRLNRWIGENKNA